jgi:hypothetical protein
MYYFEAVYNISGFHLNDPCIIRQPESEVLSEYLVFSLMLSLFIFILVYC